MFDVAQHVVNSSSGIISSDTAVDAAALEAMEELLRTGVPFEINTGAMYRGLRTEPYPSYGLLKELQKRGGEIVLSSDSHDCNSIGFAFGEVAQACRELGFRYTKIWTPEGMKEISLD